MVKDRGYKYIQRSKRKGYISGQVRPSNRSASSASLLVSTTPTRVFQPVFFLSGPTTAFTSACLTLKTQNSPVIFAGLICGSFRQLDGVDGGKVRGKPNIPTPKLLAPSRPRVQPAPSPPRLFSPHRCCCCCCCCRHSRLASAPRY